MALTIKASEQSFIRWRLHSWSKRVFYIPAFVLGHSSIQPKRRTIQMEKHFTRAVAGNLPRNRSCIFPAFDGQRHGCAFRMKPYGLKTAIMGGWSKI